MIFIEIFGLRSKAPRARNAIAWANGPGKVVEFFEALKARNILPLQGKNIYCTIPGRCPGLYYCAPLAL
jgi:hypothetical protein